MIRWSEKWLDRDHPGTTQTRNTKMVCSIDDMSTEELEIEMRSLASDPRFSFKHNYEEGDLVLVNNYSMLHGREPFAGERELWRIQAIPPSRNMPEYYRKYGIGKM